MTRASSFKPWATLTTVCAGLLVLMLGGGVARANTKTIAVLGLEVTGSNVTQQATDAAVELTKQLRAQAMSGIAPGYTLLPGSGKELLDEKLLFNCSNESPECMTKIANDLGAQVLVFGNLQLNGSQYAITLKIFDASVPGATGKVGRTLKDKVEAGKLTPGNLDAAKFAGSLYRDVTGGATVVLTLRVNGSDSGTIRINNQPAQPYTSGRLTTNAPAGKVTVVVEPNEKTVRRYDGEINVDGDEMTKEITLAAMPPPTDTTQPCTTPGCQDAKHEYGGTVSDTERPGGGWRTAFVASLVGTGAAGVLLGYGLHEQSTLGSGPGILNFGKKCTAINSAMTKFQQGDPTNCDDGSTYALETNIAWSGIAVFGALAVVAYYEGYTKTSSSPASEHASNDRGHRKHRDRFIVTPVVGPNGGGATVQLNW